jgi:hypothetical protein
MRFESTLTNQYNATVLTLSNILTKIIDLENFEAAWSLWSSTLDSKIDLFSSERSLQNMNQELTNLINCHFRTFNEKISNLNNLFIKNATEGKDFVNASFSSLTKNSYPLLTHNSFSSWTKSNKESILNNFESLPDKKFIESLINSLSSKFQNSLANLNNDFSSFYQIIKTNSVTLSNIHNSIIPLPAPSFFDSHFVNLEKHINVQFKNLENNDFFINNLNRLLELLSENNSLQSINQISEDLSNHNMSLNSLLIEIKSTMLDNLNLLSNSMLHSSEELSNLLSQNTFLDNTTVLNSLLIEVKSIILDKSNFLSDSILHSADQISEEFSGLLDQNTFLDNASLQNSLLTEI